MPQNDPLGYLPPDAREAIRQALARRPVSMEEGLAAAEAGRLPVPDSPPLFRPEPRIMGDPAFIRMTQQMLRQYAPDLMRQLQLVSQSPTMYQDETLRKWSPEAGKRVTGSNDLNRGDIYVNPESSNVLRTLTHELGHTRYGEGERIPTMIGDVVEKRRPGKDLDFSVLIKLLQLLRF